MSAGYSKRNFDQIAATDLLSCEIRPRCHAPTLVLARIRGRYTRVR
jgi:hypothetical protein